MVQETLKKIEIIDDEALNLEALVCCLSGGGTKLAQELLYEAFEKIKIKYKIFITNDAVATAFTSFKNGKNLNS